MPDQARRRAVEDAPHGERTAARDARFLLDEVGGASLREILQLLALDAEGGGVAPVAPHDRLAHERLIASSVVEVAVPGSRACSIASFRCRCEDSTLPFSWPRPRLLRVPTMP